MMIPIAKPLIGEEEKAAVLAVLSSGQLAQGKQVARFEENFAAWAGRQHAVAVSNGTTALQLALLAHGIGAGDEVITSSFSFIASANCALYVGATPVFADIDAKTFCITAESIAECITPRTKAIIVVHLFGQACDMQPIRALADRHNLALIEDACQSHGARQDGLMVGSWGTACYSFYPTKNMTTGEGGMVTTDDPVIADKVRLLREHGMRRRYHHELLGYNMRMTDMQAAIGIVQLTHLDGWTRQRQQNAAQLAALLADLPGVEIPTVRAGAEHVWHQYTVRVAGGTAVRDGVVAELNQRGVGCGVYYPIPIHKQQVYQELNNQDVLPVTDNACQEVLSLPVHPSLTAADLETVARAVREVVAALQHPAESNLVGMTV